MISIVVCTFNGKSRLSSCLQSLISQEGAPDYEVIVVDNASTDGTSEYVRNFFNSQNSLSAWNIVNEPQPGLLHARLAGLKEARFDWVLFCDDDNVLFPDFLFHCHNLLSKNPKIGVLGSHGIPEFLGTKPDWFDQYSSSYAVGPQLGGQLNKKRLTHVYGACSVYLKKPLLELIQKWFNPVLSDRKGAQLASGGDVEWCWLMQLMDFQLAYSEKLQFYHQLPASRLTWDYYLRLKRGISSNAGLLSSYEFYFLNSFKSSLFFRFWYLTKLFRSIFLYWKYRFRWKGNPSQNQDQLSFAILESKMKSYLSQGPAAFSHFNQLKQYFGS